MPAWIGCELLADARKDEWFFQLVDDGRTLHGRVLATAIGIGREETLKKVMGFAGVSKVEGKAKVVSAWGPVHDRRFARPEGIMTAVKRCGAELDKLAGRVALATALISLTETLRHG